MRGGDVRIVLQVVDVVEAVGGEQLGRRERLAAFLAPNCRKCASGSTCAAATSGLAARYCARVEVERRHAAFLPADWSKWASGSTPAAFTSGLAER